MKKFCAVLLSFIISFSSLSFGNKIEVTESLDSATELTSSDTECVDAWIIIGGDKPDHEYSDLILLTTEWVYDRIKDCGLSDDDIYYLVPEYGTRPTASHVLYLFQILFPSFQDYESLCRTLHSYVACQC